MDTVGALVFVGSNVRKSIFPDAASGQSLRNRQAQARPMAFAVDGQQRVIISGGQTMFVLGLPH